MLQFFELNTEGRDFVVGDIHGCFDLLQSRLDGIGFDPERDRLFSVGDLVDRGAQSELALEWLDKPWFHAVRGNHEDMAIDWAGRSCQMDPGNYAANGGAWNIANTQDERRRFADAFARLPLAIEIETATGSVGIVHAECPFDDWDMLHSALSSNVLDPGERFVVQERLLWARNRITMRDASVIEGISAVVVGHTPVREPVRLGNVHYIDTGAFFTGCLTILDISTL